MKKALLIVGHGSRSRDARETLSEIVGLVRGLSDFDQVEGAFMQLCSPSIEEQISVLSAAGIGEITLVPHFLYEGIHIKEDIPRIIQELSKTYKNLRFKLARPIGAAPELANILINRAKCAVEYHYEETVA